jgi:hypothetical protein
MAAPAAPAVRAQIESLGAVFRSFPVERSGVNPLKDLRTFFSLCTTFRQTKPDIILAYTIKPVIWGGLAAAFAVCCKIGVIFETSAFYRF